MHHTLPAGATQQQRVCLIPARRIWWCWGVAAAAAALPYGHGRHHGGSPRCVCRPFMPGRAGVSVLGLAHFCTLPALLPSFCLLSLIPLYPTVAGYHSPLSVKRSPPAKAGTDQADTWLVPCATAIVFCSPACWHANGSNLCPCHRSSADDVENNNGSFTTVCCY